MQVEIICPGGIGRGTKVLVDGREVSRIKHLVLEIPADGIATLQLTRYLTRDGEILAPVDGETQEQVLVFKGQFASMESADQPSSFPD